MNRNISAALLFVLAAAGAHAQALTALPKASAYEVVLRWTAPASSPDPAAGYDAFRAPSGGTSYAQLNATPVAATTYTDAAVSGAETYDYVVESVDANGVTSAPSNLASVAVPGMLAAGTLIGKTT